MEIKDSIKLCLIVIATILMSCGQTETNSLAHKYAKEWNESIEEIHEDLSDRVAKLEAENEDLSAIVLNTATPDSRVLRKIKNHQTLIADYKGILKKHELLMEQNQKYLNHHESNAIGAIEIRAQHEQIYKNLLVVQEDATQITEQIETVLALYAALEKDIVT